MDFLLVRIILKTYQESLPSLNFVLVSIAILLVCLTSK